MLAAELLGDAFDRIRKVVHATLHGASLDELTFAPDPGANTIGWLVWHLTRVQDGHIADVIGANQVWISGGWVDRFGLPFDRRASGYGQDPAEVAAVRADADLLEAYFDAVHTRTLAYLDTLVEADFARIVDTSWDPPVTLAVRLVSVIADDLQHAGQAAYVRGLTRRALIA